MEENTKSPNLREKIYMPGVLTCFIKKKKEKKKEKKKRKKHHDTLQIPFLVNTHIVTWANKENKIKQMAYNIYNV